MKNFPNKHFVSLTVKVLFRYSGKKNLQSSVVPRINLVCLTNSCQGFSLVTPGCQGKVLEGIGQGGNHPYGRFRFLQHSKLTTNMNKKTECFPTSEEEKKKKLNEQAKIRMGKYREWKKELKPESA